MKKGEQPMNNTTTRDKLIKEAVALIMVSSESDIKAALKAAMEATHEK